MNKTIVAISFSISLFSLLILHLQSKLQSNFNTTFIFFVLSVFIYFLLKTMYNLLLINYSSKQEIKHNQKIARVILNNKIINQDIIKEDLYINIEKHYKTVLKSNLEMFSDTFLFIVINIIYIYVNIAFSVFMILLSLCLFFILKKTQKNYKHSVNNIYIKNNEHLSDLRTYFRNIKYYNYTNGKKIINRLNKQNHELDENFFEIASYSNKYKSWYRIFNELYVLLGLLFLIFLYNNTKINIDNLFFTFFMVGIASATIRQMSNQNLEMQWKKQYNYEINEYSFLNDSPRIIELQASEISRNGKKIISDVNLFINEENTLITGISGIGKSLLIKTLLGLNQDFKGTRKVNGKETKKLINSNVAYIEESEIRKVGSIKQLQIKKEKYLELLNIFNLDTNRFSEKNFVNNPLWSENLSTGEYRRMLIIIELLKEPKFLILDEALDNIDWKTTELIIQKLLLFKNLTLIVVSHNNDFKKYFSKVYEVKKNGTKILQK